MQYLLTELCEQVMAARGAERPLYIKGGGTKSFYGEPNHVDAPEVATLDVSGYTGIVSYQPSELVITARCGTLLSEIEEALDAERQMLAFEPPRFGPESTLGGAVAAGLSGPRRMAAGSLRDFVLGTKLLDSSGAVLNFGGEVMKNVAGYDISRLLAGSMGIFGAIMEVSVKVLPKPQQEASFVLELTEAEALASFNKWRVLPLAITGTAWLGDARDQAPGLLYVRASGSEPAVAKVASHIGGTRLDDDTAAVFWASLQDQTHELFAHRPLWRVSVPPTTTPLQTGGQMLIEWNGGLRWLSDVEDAAALRNEVAERGGHATLYRYESKPANLPVFQPLTPALQNLNRRLKQELDPVGIFNPKRLFPDF